MDKALSSIRQASYGQLMKMLITLEPDGTLYLDQILHPYLIFFQCPDTGLQNNDEALPSIRLAGRGLFVKMLITLEPHGIF